MNSPYFTNSIIEGPVGLVLVKVGNQSNATTITFFSEVAHHPCALWISLAKTAYSKELIEKAGQFSLVILNSQQKDIAASCGLISGRHHDKCSALDLYPSPSGFLFLRGALASTGCRVSRSVDIDDHTLFVGEIIETHLDSSRSHLRHLLISDLGNI